MNQWHTSLQSIYGYSWFAIAVSTCDLNTPNVPWHSVTCTSYQLIHILTGATECVNARTVCDTITQWLNVSQIYCPYFALYLFAVNCIASAETVPQQEHYPPLAESQPSKDVSSFSSSTSSPWDSPENPSQALKPIPARAQSAPITLPAEPIDPVANRPAASPPKSVDAFSSVSWSQSQWIAFSDNFAPPRRQGSGSALKELQRPQSGIGRSSRFLSDDFTDAYCKAPVGCRDDSNPCCADVFSGITDRAIATAPSGKLFNGNIINDVRDMSHAWGLHLNISVLFWLLIFVFMFYVGRYILFYRCSSNTLFGLQHVYLWVSVCKN